MIENAEKINQPAQDTPTPVTQPAPAKADTAPAVEAKAPVVSPTEKKENTTGYAIRMRNKARELEKQLAQAKAQIATPLPAPVVEAQAQPTIQTPTNPPVPAQTITENDIELESDNAIKELAKDPSIAGLSNALIDIIELVDTDKRLMRLHKVDPKLAFEEGRKEVLARAGIAPTPPMPLATTSSGGMGSVKTDLDSMVQAIDKLAPGTKEFRELAAKINAELNK